VGPDRATPYSDAYVVPVGSARSALAEEGSYFTANNATTATEITAHAAPAIGDEATKPILYLYNGGSKFITIDNVYVRTETVNTSASDVYYTVSVNSEASRDSGGTAITPQNARSDNPITSGATIYFGAVVCTPSTNRLISRTLVRQAIGVTEDRYYFQFGEPFGYTGPAYVATVSDISRQLPPVVIAPGGEFLFTYIGPSGASTAATHEFMLGYWER
jgi:hypothetical protein